MDERDERAGIKLKDAGLIGLPLQVIIGEKNIQQGKIELKERATGKSMINDIDRSLDKVLR